MGCGNLLQETEDVREAHGLWSQPDLGWALALPLTVWETLHVQPLNRGRYKGLEGNKTGGKRPCGGDHW